MAGGAAHALVQHLRMLPLMSGSDARYSACPVVPAVPVAERLPEHSGSTHSVDETALTIGPADSRKTRPP